ncbi:MAG: acetyl-CoA carboxylase biotin carboxyl carrier protein [Planctomycetota bacterium]
MIDIRKLKELVRLMVENELVELDLRDQEETVTIKRPGGTPVTQHTVVAAPTPAAASAPAPESTPAPADSTEGLHEIVSPMVGTFYSAPDPESPAYATPGTRVSPDSVVCIVEAMKVFSEIKAECSGTIEKVLVKNSEAVEYGQALFLVKPD